MSTHTDRFRPSLVTALVKVAMIGTWRGRTFLDDNLAFDDVADFVPDEPGRPVQLPVAASAPGAAEAAGPMAQPTITGPGHSVAA